MPLPEPRDRPRAPDQPDQIQPPADRIQPPADRIQPPADRIQPPADRTQRLDRPPPADERRMRALETLPPGHPSSPYLTDGSRRPPRPSLRRLELPLPGEREEAAGERSRKGQEDREDRPGTAGDRDAADSTTGRPRERQDSDAARPPEPGHRHYWAEVPRLQRMWADHEHRWPKDKQPAAAVDRSRDPPESWRSDSNLFLSPENHARMKDAISGMHNAEPRVTEDLQHIVQKSAFSAELVGLEFRQKGEDRLKEKVAEALETASPGEAPEDVLRVVPDAIRYTIRLDREDYVSGYRDISHGLEEEGYVMFYGKNYWQDGEYKGINTRWVTSEGQRFEIQFHTPESYHAKQEVTHDAYERIRNPLTTDGERAELEAFQREVSSLIPAPKGAISIPDYRKEHF